MRSIYTEQVAQVNRQGAAMGTVRRYDQVLTKNLARTSDMKPPFLQGLTILYRRRPTQPPEVLSLMNDRRLREGEYELIAGDVFLPQLAELLPRTALRVNDTWDIPREVAHRFWGTMPDIEDYELTGTLLKVSKPASGNSLIAEIAVQGQFTMLARPNAFNSRIYFTFELPSADTPAAGTVETPKEARGSDAPARAGTQKGIVEARGLITRAIMSKAEVGLTDEGNGRLKETITRELDIERRLMAATPDAAVTRVAPLEVPSPLPIANEMNSWLLYDDPAGRFHFYHPQDLQYQSAGALGVELKHSTAGRWR